MKKILSLLLILLSFQLYSQDAFLQHDSDVMEPKAEKITQKYDSELGLTAKQSILFQKKVEEFLIRRAKIESAYSGREKLNQLVALQQNETAEMGDILTQIQMDLYKKIKPRIQPVATVDE